MLSPFDEQEEWAKISDLITNLGGGNAKESMCNELEKEFKARLGKCSEKQVCLSRDGSTVRWDSWWNSRIRDIASKFLLRSE